MLAVTGCMQGVEDVLLRFKRLSVDGKSTDGQGHRDGWGIGYYCDGVHLFKKAECALTSEKYVETVRKVKDVAPRVLMAHLRKASPGTRVTDEEAHPFGEGSFLFCHNGSITQRDGQPLGKELDSILFFKKTRETSLRKGIEYFLNFKYTSLTCLFTDGHTVWGYRGFTEREDYYTLYYLKTKDFVLFCSEPLLPGEWVLLRNHELIAVSANLDIVTELG